MKNTIKVFGFMVLVVAIVFSMAVCDNGGGNPNDPNNSGDTNDPYNSSNKTAYFCTVTKTGDYYVNGIKKGKLDIPAGAQFERNQSNVYFSVLGGKVYARGRYFVSGSGKFAYWVDGVRKDLNAPAGYELGTNGFFRVSGGKVYLLGGSYYGGDTRKYCYWVDGVRKDLDIPSGHTSIGYSGDPVLSNGKVYAVGTYCRYVDNEETSRKACYWVDGVRTDLSVPAGIEFSEARHITVSDGKIYVVGSYGKFVDINDNSRYIGKACYWVNGVWKDLQIPAGIESSVASSGHQETNISGGKVYVAGSYGNYEDWGDGYKRYKAKACYWIDGVRTDLSVPAGLVEESYASHLIVSGGKVYIRGECHINTMPYYSFFYWVDGMRTDLVVPSEAAEAFYAFYEGFIVSDGKVYVIGDSCADVRGVDLNYYRGVFYWVDGVRTSFDANLGNNFIGFDGRYYAVAGGKVHFAAMGGYDHPNGTGVPSETAFYWIDGVKQNIPDAANIVAASLTAE